MGRLAVRLASESVTATWQLSCLPSWPQYWRATPTECRPFLGTPVSSMIQASMGPARSIAGRTRSRTLVSVWMRDVLGTSDDLQGLGQDAGIERRVVIAVGAGWGCAEALAHDPLRGSPVQDTLAPGIIGPIEALQQGLQVAVAGHRDA